MSDFIREVDGEYRQEQFIRFLSRYWPALVLAVAVVLGATGGWRYYEYRRQQQAEAAGARYLDAVDVAASDPKASTAELDAIGRDGPPGYRLLARMRAAGELGRTDAAAAVKLFDGVAADGTVPQEFRDVAALRAGLLSVDTADPAELRRRLEPLADANSAYRSVAREMLAAAALKRGDDAAAGRWLDLIEADPLASATSRERAGFMLGVIRASRPFTPPAPAPAAVPAPAPPAPAPAVSAAPAAPSPAEGAPSPAAPGPRPAPQP